MSRFKATKQPYPASVNFCIEFYERTDHFSDSELKGWTAASSGNSGGWETGDRALCWTTKRKNFGKKLIFYWKRKHSANISFQELDNNWNYIQTSPFIQKC